MKYYLFSFFSLIATITIAQTPQIARVSSDGNTTVIYTDIKRALGESQNDDFIYLPAGTFNVDSLIIQKRINIVGTGIYPDSTKATGKTVINGKVYLKNGRDGGSLQGIEFNNSNSLGILLINGTGDFTISKCMFNQIYDLDATAVGTINIKECVVNGFIASYIFASQGKIIFNVNNSIISQLNASCAYSIFNNCIFSGYSNYPTLNYNEFRNCVFHITNSGSTNSSRFYYSHIELASSNTTTINISGIEFNTTVDASNGNTFLGGTCPVIFSYTFDYRVKNTSTAASSGSDGTDKGIYGSMYPYNPNPYNPHIYFKSIAPSTNAQGQLLINVKVKAQ